MKITRAQSIPKLVTFCKLSVGDVFRYRDGICNTNVYMKTDSGGLPFSNAVKLDNGRRYEVRHDANVIKQSASLTVADDRDD